MKTNIKYILLVLCLIAKLNSNAYIYDYAILDQPKEVDCKRKIYLMFDNHISKSLKNIEWDADFIDLWHESEKYFYGALKRLNTKYKKDTIDIIWESNSYFNGMDFPNIFLAFGPRIILGRCKNLNFVHADNHRAFAKAIIQITLLPSSKKMNYEEKLNCLRNYFEKFYADPEQCPYDPSLIEGTYGTKLLDIFINDFNYLRKESYYQNYLKYVAQKPNFEVYRKDIDDRKSLHLHEPYHKLADMEMISKILSSKAKIIILYAGGYHSQNIYDYLKKLHFEIIKAPERKPESRISELPCDKLKFLYNL